MMGVGGVGMAGLALLLAGRGINVSGSDCSENNITQWLLRHGIDFRNGHNAANVPDNTEWAIRTGAVPLTNPEVVHCLNKNLPVFLRGAVLAAYAREKYSIAVGGTHGKSTTTAMIIQLMQAAGIDTSYSIGGEVKSLAGVAGIGTSPHLVVEADESDGTLALYAPDIALVTNIEPDHLDYFADTKALESCFLSFFTNTKKRIVCCVDDPCLQRLIPEFNNVLTYGFSSSAVIQGSNFRQDRSHLSVDVSYAGKQAGTIRLPVIGQHNATNALAACAVAFELEIPFSKVQKAFTNYVPVQRRFEVLLKNKSIMVVSDYAHHPTEIRAVIKMAQQYSYKRIVAIFQPHRYSRTLALGDQFPPAFLGVEHVILAPVYAASENSLVGGASSDLYELFIKSGRTNVELAHSLADSWQKTRKILQEGDILLVVGAGDVNVIGEWAKDELENSFEQEI